MITLLIVKIVGLIVGVIATIGRARKDSKVDGEKRWAMRLAVLGFGVAVIAELVDTSVKQRAAENATNRNNALLAEVQRSLHPLFPLSVDVRFRAPLRSEQTKAFRSALEKEYQHQRLEDPNSRIIWLHTEEPYFPSPKKDPVAFQIVAAELGATVSIYSRQHTRDGQFEQPDIEFSPCPICRYVKPRQLVIDDKAHRQRLEDRTSLFSPDQGLYMSDGAIKIDFVDAKSSTEMVSVDDLMGATLEITPQPLDPPDEDCKPATCAQPSEISFAGIAIILPGWRQLVIDHQKFTPVPPSKEWPDLPRYRFVIPEQKDQFDKLIRDERIWKAAEQP